MKKWLLFLLLIVSLLALMTACGTDVGEDTTTAPPETEPPVTPTFTVTFKNDDGTVLETVEVTEGFEAKSTVTPTKAGDDIYHYQFTGWDKDITRVTEDMEVTATFEKVPGTVKWFEGKKIVFLGDSVTRGHKLASITTEAFSYVVGKELAMNSINMGTNSRTYCTGGHRVSCLDDIPKIPKDADIVMVCLGNNDWDQAVKNGVFAGKQKYAANATYYTLGEVGTTDTSTIRGAVAAYCERIREHLDKEDALIFFMTPLITSWNQSVDGNSKRYYDTEKKNIHGYTQTEMVDAIIEVCDSYDIDVVDVYRNSGVTAANAATYYDDGIHPNKAGHKAIADEIVRALKGFILKPVE